MQRRHIQPEQRLCAEDDLAVAVASILAGGICAEIRVAGTSDLSYVAKKSHIPSHWNDGTAIVMHGGKPALATVAKLRFKITTSILANTEDAL